jgi:hypothetical protein
MQQCGGVAPEYFALLKLGTTSQRFFHLLDTILWERSSILREGPGLGTASKGYCGEDYTERAGRPFLSRLAKNADWSGRLIERGEL